MAAKFRKMYVLIFYSQAKFLFAIPTAQLYLEIASRNIFKFVYVYHFGRDRII